MSNDFSQKIKKIQNWIPPENWLKITTIDTHTAGEPLRIILSGILQEQEGKILEAAQAQGLGMNERKQMGDWVAFSFSRKAD